MFVAFQIRMPGIKIMCPHCHYSRFLLTSTGIQQVMTQVLGALPSILETHVGSLAPGFGLAQT